MSPATSLPFAFLLALGSLLAVLTSAATAAPRPNIVLINCDDLGYGDLGCYGAPDIRTPHLDRMATEGMRFTDFSVTAALCSPSRAALMTGKYQTRLGLARGVLRPDATNGLYGEETTLAEVLKPAGYATGCVGKWHLGFLSGMLPLDQGFDSYYGVLHNLDHFETEHFEKEGGMPVLRGNLVERRPAVPAEMTGLYTAEALQFLEENRENPFFLYLSHAMPHLPFDASAEFLGKSARGLYGDCIEELDWSTGEILGKLRSLGLAEKTLVIFTSDNGPERNAPGTAAPFSGTKHTLYEGGLRVPFLAWWPGTVPAGRVSSEFICVLDILPTFAALAGTPSPATDGYDISRLLLGEEGAVSPRTTMHAYWGGKQGPAKESVRKGKWKLHLNPGPLLFDSEQDPAETTDIGDLHPETRERLSGLAASFREETDPMERNRGGGEIPE